MVVLWTLLIKFTWAVLIGCGAAALLAPLFLVVFRGDIERFFRRLLVELDEERRVKEAIRKHKLIDSYYAARKDEEAEKDAIKGLVQEGNPREIPIRRKTLAQKTEIRRREERRLLGDL